MKAAGLAAGKGVVVASNNGEACAAVDVALTERRFGEAGSTVVVEELLEGEEVSLLAFCDGTSWKTMPPAQDHKRALDGDRGDNTGGMGAYCPCPLITSKQIEDIGETIIGKVAKGMKEEGNSFVGVIYAGLMLTSEGPKVLEYNCRFGDPETQVILPLLESDLYSIVLACSKGELDKIPIKWRENAYAAGIVLASKGYPASAQKGDKIEGLLQPLPKDNYIFHSGTSKNKNGEIITAGGRVIFTTVVADSLFLAAARATKLCSSIQFNGGWHRNDIAAKGIARLILKEGQGTYLDAGVDIDAGEELVSAIKPAVDATKRAGSLGGIGGFGGLFDVKASGYKDPILVSGTDGVGTKLAIAQAVNKHSTIGIDLVAMCVNDILANGAEPLFFLDYFACGRLEVGVAADVVAGVAEGCRQAGCALVGGETAEMPGLYGDGEYDIAGFSVGAVERASILPLSGIEENDVLIGLPSSGLHSNGFSLARKAVKKSGVLWNEPSPFGPEGKTLGEALLEPTKIYVKALLSALRSGKVKALAHITGGGLTENIPRVLPNGIGIELDAKSWDIPHVFAWISAVASVNAPEMLRTFNCGLGIVLVVAPEFANTVQTLVSKEFKPRIIGRCIKYNPNTNIPRVNVKHWLEVLEMEIRPYIPHVTSLLVPRNRKKVAVLISGSGTNLQALLQAVQDPLDGQNIGADIVLVISNKRDVKGLEIAENAGVATRVIPHNKFKSREAFEKEMHTYLEEANIELVCLAGFMRVLTPWFVSRWVGRLINIHPSLLPLFKGIHAQRQALESGVRITGCSVHFVEEDIDAGGIIVQESVKIDPNETEESLIEKIKQIEHKAYPMALQLVATKKVCRGDDRKLIWS